jgi:transposase
MAYANDLRQKLLQAVDTRQGSQSRLAEIFGVSLSWVKGVVRRRRETGNPDVLPHAGGRRPKLNAEQRHELRLYVEAHPDTLLRESHRWLEAAYHIDLSLSGLSRLLASMNLPRKKSHSMPRNATRRLTGKNGRFGARRLQRSIRRA